MIKSTNAKFHKSIVLYILGLLVLLNRFFILKEFNFQYTGTDDLVFWQAAVDYSQGIFHEPYFYGQDYNFALESILAVPLLLIGIPAFIALPLVSSFVGIFPFFVFAIALFRKGFTNDAFLFLLIPLAMPIEYDIITSVSRGFTSGLFFCSFLIFPLLSPTKIKSFIILGLAVSFGYIFNANSLILSFPICLYLLFKNYKSPYFYLLGLAATIPAFLILYFSKEFYVNHPEFLTHSMWGLDFKFARVVYGLSHLDDFFRYLTPVLWSGNWLVLLIILFLAIATLKKNWKKGVSLLLNLLFIVVLLGITKIHDDAGVIFLSSTRMFLAIPLLFGVALFWTKKDFIDENKLRLIIFTVGISVFLVKISSYETVIKEHTEETNYGAIAIKKIDDLKVECSEINEIATHYDVDLLVFIPNYRYNTPYMISYNLGCSIIEEQMASSVMSTYERRTWVFEKEKNTARKTVLLYNLNIDETKEYDKFIEYEFIKGKPNMVLVRNNDKTLFELSKVFDFRLMRSTY
ncbi:hypothetical protein ERX46_03625 [Brumimicrobium glaciale]|uniref:Glycosyltransferase RgtA/B/C/D-like domain-containing protein n=1 Tax=Brumimicrobium glaciale TaxID=200475 RepID=A0A4Q4KRP1_9FLAO|nr:hypothetical protein [Brumimicrobium glaciale]RYM36097.1 hypothetical protein ERX46_03625 [Brumimicrobium glaciale]